MIELLGVGVPRGRADEPAGRLSPADRVRFLVARALSGARGISSCAISTGP